MRKIKLKKELRKMKKWNTNHSHLYPHPHHFRQKVSHHHPCKRKRNCLPQKIDSPKNIYYLKKYIKTNSKKSRKVKITYQGQYQNSKSTKTVKLSCLQASLIIMCWVKLLLFLKSRGPEIYTNIAYIRTYPKSKNKDIIYTKPDFNLLF